MAAHEADHKRGVIATIPVALGSAEVQRRTRLEFERRNSTREPVS
jgi:hypothetical protein